MFDVDEIHKHVSESGTIILQLYGYKGVLVPAKFIDMKNSFNGVDAIHLTLEYSPWFDCKSVAALNASQWPHSYALTEIKDNDNWSDIMKRLDGCRPYYVQSDEPNRV